MKMMRSTRRTSISGVTLISETACPVPPPPPIPIAISPLSLRCALQLLDRIEQCRSDLLLGRRLVGVTLLSQKTELTHASGTDTVYCVHDLAVVRPDVRSQVNFL